MNTINDDFRGEMEFYDSMQGAEKQSPRASNRNTWGQVFELNVANSAAPSLQAQLLSTGVLHCHPAAAGAPYVSLKIKQTRGNGSYIQSIVVPPWGVAFQLPAGFVQLAIAADIAGNAITAATKWIAGVSCGLGIDSWLPDQTTLGGLLISKGTSSPVIAPLDYSRRVQVTCLQGVLVDPIGNNVLTAGQSVIRTATPLQYKASGAVDAIIDIAWEVFS